jgi:hypothetical protein
MKFVDNRETDNSVDLSNNACTNLVVEKFKEYIQSSRPITAPMQSALKLSKEDMPKSQEEINFMKSIPYRAVIGSLMYMATSLRMDILFAVNKCARYMENPGIKHWQAVVDILRYLNTARHGSITYQRPSAPELGNRLAAFVDSDHAADIDDRRSTTGFVVFLNGGPISWATRGQKSASGSTAESEYKAMYEVGIEVVWLRNLMTELGYSQQDPTAIYEDNTACEVNCKDPVNHGRLKAVDTKYHIIRDWVREGKINVIHIDTSNQLADFFTKPLPPAAFLRLREHLIGVAPGLDERFSKKRA